MTNEELINYFDDQLFLPDLQAKEKPELFEEIIDQFVKVKYFKNKNIILEMLHQRERLGSTGIGKNVAIPHGRSTSASDIMIAFGKSIDGIEYDAIDNKPVHLIFMIIAPPLDEDNIYLPILGKMVEILNKTKNRNKLLQAETSDDFIEIILKG